MSYDIVKQELSNSFSQFSDNYNQGLQRGERVYSEERFFWGSTLYDILYRQKGDETRDTLMKDEIQCLIMEFNATTDSTVSIDYE